MSGNSPEKIFTVSEITKDLRLLVESSPGMNGVSISGEVYNLTHHTSGHIYFSLKDEGAVLSAVFFRHMNQHLKFRIEPGMKIIARGSITVYEKGGRYQLNVVSASPEGLGELQKRLEQLKAKLRAEGVFSPENKKKLPFLPRKIGVVTSPTGAAFRDIVKVAVRRNPRVRILLAPATVQGTDAAKSIAAAIRELNNPVYGVDLIIAGRGGGSFEDLYPFSEEETVRAFFESRVPVISAVGHETDHPLSDDAADACAPTPSAASEIAVPLISELTAEIDYYFTRIRSSAETLIKEKKMDLKSVLQSKFFASPLDYTGILQMQLSEAEAAMASSMRELVSLKKQAFSSATDISLLIKTLLNEKRSSLDKALKSLYSLSPYSIMKRGYALPFDENNSIIKSVSQAAPGSGLRLRLHDGYLNCTVNSIKKEKLK